MNIAGKTALAALAAAAMLQAAPARAGLITRTFDFSVSNIATEWITGTAPVDPVVGSVTVTFDPNVDASETTANITLNSLNIALASPIAFLYVASEGFFDIGGSTNSVSGTALFDNDFSLRFTGGNTLSPVLQVLAYTQGTGGLYISSIGTVTVEGASAQPVPEPASLAMFGTALLGLCFFSRRRGGI